MDNTATVKTLHIDASEFEMPEDVKPAKIAKALSHEDMDTGMSDAAAAYTVSYSVSSYGIMF